MNNDIDLRLDRIVGTYMPNELRHSRQNILVDILAALGISLLLIEFVRMPAISAAVGESGLVVIPAIGAVLAIVLNRLRAYVSLKNARQRFRAEVARTFFTKASSAWLYEAFECLTRIEALFLSGAEFDDEYESRHGEFDVNLYLAPECDRTIYTVRLWRRVPDGYQPKICSGEITSYFSGDGSDTSRYWAPTAMKDVNETILALAGGAVVAALAAIENAAEARREARTGALSSISQSMAR